MMPVERCGECRFASNLFTTNDVLGTLRSVATWYDLLTRDLPDDTFWARPAADRWSVAEYGTHMAVIVDLHAAGVALMLDAPGTVLDAFIDDGAIDPTPARPPRLDVVIALAAAVESLLPLAMRTARERGTLTLGDEPLDSDHLVRHTCHDMLHHFQDIGRIVHALGAGVCRQRGTVERVNVSGGGVPKRAVEHAQIGVRGIEGDRQRSRRHHGRTWQALCLYSLEAIDRLRAEGHPIEPGAAGENLTLSGIDWASLRPGVRMRVGTALVETTLPALPCAKNAQWFHDGNFNRMHHAHHWAETRWYARVVEDGDVGPGAPVTVEP